MTNYPSVANVPFQLGGFFGLKKKDRTVADSYRKPYVGNAENKLGLRS